ncbi:FAD-dependent oxidoreductase [Chitinophaga ginsengisoli]|uniref:Flavin-dependent monooxygenase n=1 Tax=Chitinophaga ginsengisoli TaxID=363837 RepID=A0A2P8FTB1_9BACT|nr:NAD(P)/FAD-dependent oxidoreductase [Chitinophaga ginsengisoli]PSL24875.1 2-polyprenyl-6-methoxyphenol hydroxylase-like FAD-dependent oxidoreductase [Chitinophaga ginsengisoli]
MSILKNKKIAIVGGGPGGLTLARILQMNNADVKVYERDPGKDARAQGATLDLHYESGLKALREAGLMDAFKANYRPGADRMRVMDKHANLVMEDAEREQGDEAYFRPEIDRGPLKKILLESLHPDTVIWNSHFVSLTRSNSGWQLTFRDGATVAADIVIAADGANSKIRPYITPIKPFFAGLTVVEGAVYNSATATPNIHRLLQNGKIFAMGDDKSIIISSKGDGSLVFYTGCKTDEYWSRDCGIDFSDKAQVFAWFKTAFAGWAPVWDELFENASSHFVTRPQYCMPLDQTWEALPDLTMLGDAAHLMPPYAGEGVNMAMLDALELGQCLTNNTFPDTLTAIAYYEQQMRIRASETAAQTLESTDALHSPDAIAFIKQAVS